MTTLTEVVEQQEMTNGRLDKLDERFGEFFDKMERDRLDLLEMLRERQQPPEEKSEPVEVKVKQEKDSKFEWGLGKFLGGLIGIFAAVEGIAYLFQNAVNAFSLGLTSVGSTLKGLGTKISNLVNKLKPEVPEGSKSGSKSKTMSARQATRQGLKQTAKGKFVGEIVKNKNTFTRIIEGADGKPAAQTMKAADVPAEVKKVLESGKRYIPKAPQAPGRVSKFLGMDVGEKLGSLAQRFPRTAGVLKKAGIIGTGVSAGMSVVEGANVMDKAFMAGVDNDTAALMGLENAGARFAGTILDLPKLVADAGSYGLSSAGIIDEETDKEFRNFSFSDMFGKMHETVRLQNELTKDMVAKRASPTGSAMSVASSNYVAGMAPVFNVFNQPQTSNQVNNTSVAGSSGSTTKPIHDNGSLSNVYTK